MSEMQIPEIGFLRLPQILKLIPIGKSTWWNGIASGRFPKPVKFGPRMSVWKVQDIRDLIENYPTSCKNQREKTINKKERIN